MKTIYKIGTLITSLCFSIHIQAQDFQALDQALSYGSDSLAIAPVFDFDSDGCLPSAGISRTGEKNGGQKPSGSIGGACRSTDFLNSSNTYHRYACLDLNGSEYCGHVYSLYFEKDQLFSGIESGHRHDWEHAVIYTKNGWITHGGYSAHGDVITQPSSSLQFEGRHLKVVYHKDGVSTHALRFAKSNESAENPYNSFVTPTIVSWYSVEGDGLTNADMRSRLNSYDYGSANLPITDGRIVDNLNKGKPSEYPVFTWDSVINSQ